MNCIDLRLKASVLEQYQLPDIQYPISLEMLEDVLAHQGQLPFDVLLHQLQLRSAQDAKNFRQLEQAMARLAELLAPDDPRTVLSAQGENWWLEVGAVNLNKKIITIQRGDVLIAALTATEHGKLRLASFRPFDAKSAAILISLGQRPDPQFGVCMRDDNWEYALDCSAANGNFYAAERGEAYLSYWEYGLGKLADGDFDRHWISTPPPARRRACDVIIELGVHYLFSEN